MDPLSPSKAPQVPSSTSPERPMLAQKPSLLPAFEPLSSSPLARPRSSKRKYEDESPSRPKAEVKYYPTPVPTSSTGILPSSPTSRPTRPGLQRTNTSMSQRAALTAMPTVDIPADGSIVRMGRSSNSSDYQLSVNRFISRVHIQVSYHAPSVSHVHGKVIIECCGENGAKVHSGGRAYTLSKGGSFSSDNPAEEIMLDVQDARVLLAWPFVPRNTSALLGSDVAWDINESPTRRLGSSPPAAFASSPPRPLGSPISPSRRHDFDLGNVFSSQNEIQVYEDADSGEDIAKSTENLIPVDTVEKTSRSNTNSTDDLRRSTQSSVLSFPPDDLSDCDEENDPIIHSFGPFGDNVLGRMASFTAASPQRCRQPLKSNPQSPAQPLTTESFRKINEAPIKNHVINQLAFSRVHSMPLSTILGNLPADLKCDVPHAGSSKVQGDHADAEESWKLSTAHLKNILDNTPCVGEIAREGKDAAGKPLENEFYYVPEMDQDEARRHTVTGGLGKTGIRSVRKSHKQYYWKKPRY